MGFSIRGQSLHCKEESRDIKTLLSRAQQFYLILGWVVNVLVSASHTVSFPVPHLRHHKVRAGVAMYHKNCTFKKQTTGQTCPCLAHLGSSKVVFLFFSHNLVLTTSNNTALVQDYLLILFFQFRLTYSINSGEPWGPVNGVPWKYCHLSLFKGCLRQCSQGTRPLKVPGHTAAEQSTWHLKNILDAYGRTWNFRDAPAAVSGPQAGWVWSVLLQTTRDCHSFLEASSCTIYPASSAT